MAIVTLPIHINPFQLADNESTLVGELSLVGMDRLLELIGDQKNAIDVNLIFGRDVSNYAFVRGSIKTKFTLLCQRCDGPLSLPLNIAVALSPVRTDEEAEQLPEEYEPLLIVDNTILLSLMVEEELLLSIPIVPRHSEKDCPGKSTYIEWEEDQEQETTTPFAGLKKLLRE